MSAQKTTARGALGAFAAFVGMSAIAGLLVTAAVTPAIAVTGMAANNSIGMFEGLPEYLQIEGLAQNSTIYAKKGKKQVPIATFYSQNRVEVGWKDISQNLKDAAVGTEDPRFYEHGGVDITGTIRGALSTYVLHKDIQGGSSITQQYVKNVLIMKCERLNIVVEDPNPKTQEKKQKAQTKKYQNCYLEATAPTPDRKLKEMKWAIGIEKKYSKDQILRQYLNIAGFGGQVYGVEAAARYYFGTTAKKITLSQAATLIAILNEPNDLRIDQSKKENKDNNEENGYAAAKLRRDYVLDRMYINHKITKKQRDEAKATKVEPKITPQANGCATAAKYHAAFYCDMVQRTIQNDDSGIFGKTDDDRAAFLRRGGLKIYTPLNLNLQATAQKAVRDYIPPTERGLNLGASNVSVELGTGRVLTMVQNRPFNNSGASKAGTTAINYNTDFKYGGSRGFQTGSTYKAFTLVEWLKEGHSLNEIINAPGDNHTYSQSQFHSSCGGIDPGGVWEVGNDAYGEGGPQTILSATTHSVNTAFSQMGTKLDLCGIKNSAQALGVHLAYPYTDNDDGTRTAAEIGANPASILGTNDIAPLTMATAYAGIANKGKSCTPIVIDKIVDSTGKKVQVPKSTCTQAIPEAIAAGATYALERVMSGGTGTSANPNDGVPLMGKTGTTDHAEQNWLVTSTTKVATATWVGNVQMTKQTDGTWGNMNFGHVSFNGWGGRNVKFIIAKPVIAAINAIYGGSAFVDPESAMLYAKQVTVPDLTGKSTEEAKSILEGLGFSFIDGGKVDGPAPGGVISKTNPAGGSSISVGSAVTVYTSKGNQAAVPNVIGVTAQQAIQTLTSQGFKFSYSGDLNDVVTATDPKAGSGAKHGTKVKITAKSPDNGNKGKDGDGNNNGGD